MSRQKISNGTGRSVGRAGILLGAVLGLSLSTGPAAHAGDGGLLGDTVEVVGGTAGQVLDPVLETVESTVPQPVQQVVEPVVPQPVEPVLNQPTQTVQGVVRNTEQAVQGVVRDTEQAVQGVVRDTEQAVQAVVRDTEQVVQETVRGTEQAAEPVVRVVEPAGPRGDEPAPGTVDPVVESAPAPTASQPPVAASPTGGHTAGGSAHVGAQHVVTGTHGTGAEQRPARSAALASLPDLAPRAGAAHLALRDAQQVYVLRDSYDPRSDERLWTLTNKLMHMWAAPAGVNAGLRGDEGPGLWRPGAFDLVSLMLGLLLGFLSLVLARRTRQVAGFTARPTR